MKAQRMGWVILAGSIGALVIAPGTPRAVASSHEEYPVWSDGFPCESVLMKPGPSLDMPPHPD